MDPISYFQAIILGTVQGLAEPFPISSLGHAVVLPHFLGWNIHQNADYFLAFLVATHLATAIVLFFFFLKDWMRIFRGIGRSLRDREVRADDVDAKLGWLLVVGTIPAGLLGLLLEHSLRSVFASASAAAGFLIVNGLLLLLFERWRTRAPAPDDWKGDSDARIAKLTYGEAVGVGAAQAAALIPGISRSGITMGGGLLFGLSNEDAARYSFLLATPIILAAGVYKVPDLMGHLGDGIRGQALVGAVVAAIAAYASTRFLVRFFETQSLTPFGIYCLGFGAFCIVRFAVF
jgi:undecaprenyl-diphosphatase